MKNLFKIAVFLLLLCNLPASVSAFADAPVAVVVLDGTGGYMDKSLPAIWREQVRRNFHFPDYKLIEQAELSKALQGRMPLPEKRQPYYQKGQLQQISDLTKAELVVVIRVNQLYERIIRSWRPEGETFSQIGVSIDVSAYKKATDQYLLKKVRHFETDVLGSLPAAEKTAIYGVEDAIYYFYEQWQKQPQGDLS